jgi:hypothetical protein
MPEAKKIVTQQALPVTQTDSAPTEEINHDVLINSASELGSELDFSNDVTPSTLDWSEMEPLEEFDRIAADRGVGPQSAPQDAQIQETAPQPDMTDSMKSRISKLKQGQQNEIAGKDQAIAEKDAIIAAREQQINELQTMAQDYQKLQSTYVPPVGDVDEMSRELTALDNKLQDEGDTYTPAEVALHLQARHDLQRKKDRVADSQVQAQGLLHKQQQMREQSDQYVRDNYPFVSDPDSEYYHTLKNQAYPMLESVVGPNFKNHPQDMVLAAELSKIMVDAGKYNQLMGNQPAPRQQAVPMAGANRPSRQPQAQSQQTYSQEVRNHRGANVNEFAKLLQRRGMSWRP